jgi:C-terminal processing protease CtpA/Prc
MTMLVACGGGGGGGGGAAGFSPPPVSNPPPPPVDPYTPGVFEPSEDFRYLCETPPGTSPGVQGTTTDENNWLRSWSNELYLWYDEIVDRNPANYGTPAYFELQKTERLTASGAPKDKFHFSIPTAEWIALSQSGESAGYGSEFALLSAAPPREIVVAFTYPGTPAAAAGLVRGTEIIAINGEDVATSNDVELLNAALFPAGRR